MTRQQRVNRLSGSAIALSITAALATGGGLAWWGFQSTQQPIPSKTTSTIVQQPRPPAPVQSTTAKIYLLKDTGRNL